MSTFTPKTRAKKRFGQHFLTDQNIVASIVQAIAPKPGDHLIEIGPGQGVLTGPLLRAAGALTVVEIDRDLAQTLARRLDDIDGKLEVVEQDVLRYPFQGESLRVVGNLPYNISTPLLFHLFDCAPRILDMHFMLQKEVVDRLVATPGSRAYGRLSVMAQFRAQMDLLFDVPPSAFDPPPKVNSAVIRLKPKTMTRTDEALAKSLDAITRAAFGQRRKTLRNALSSLLTQEQIASAGVSGSARAETLSLELFLNLAEVLDRCPKAPAAG